MDESRRIPIPLARRWQRFRERMLPPIIFLACVAATAWLWQRQGATPMTSGELEAARVDVVSSAAGQLVSLPSGQWTLFDSVQANELVARLDDRLVKAGLETARRELEKLRLEVYAASEQLKLDDSERELDHHREHARLTWTLQQRQLDVLDRITAIETDRIDQQRLDVRLQQLEPLLERGAITYLDINDARQELALVTERIAKHERALEQARMQAKVAEDQVAQHTERLGPEYQRLLAPLEAAIAVQEASLAGLQLQLEALQIRAPFAGVISAIHVWPGQMVQPGDPILTIAAEQSRYVIAYLRDGSRFLPEAGMTAYLRTRHEQPILYTTHVEQVGPQIEPLPPHQLRDPRLSEWGLPVRIALPDAARLRPGELVDVRFSRR